MLKEFKAKEKAEKSNLSQAKAGGNLSQPKESNIESEPSTFDEILQRALYGDDPNKRIKEQASGCGDCSSGCGSGQGDGGEDDDLLRSFTAPKIFFASRTHKQLGQLVKELKRSGYSPQFTVLGSRNQYCVNDRVRAAKDINESCKEHLKECSFFGKNLNKAIDSFGKRGANMDIEDLVKFGKNNKACPYFLSREQSKHSDIIFAPYNYIMDPGIRSAMGIELENSVVIIDEAHNIEDTCRDAGSFEITSDSLYALQTELNIILSGTGKSQAKCPDSHRKLLHVATIFHTWINTQTVNPSSLNQYEEKVDIWRGTHIQETLRQLGVHPEVLEDWKRHLEAIVMKAATLPTATKKSGPFEDDDEDDVLLSSGSSRVFQGLFNTLDLMLSKGKESLDSYRMVRLQKIRTEKTSRRLEVTLGFWCLGPDVIFKPLANRVKSIILTSGTLSPMNTFASELFTRFDEQLEALHIINKEQVWIGCLPTSPQGVSFIGNFKNMETFQFQDELGRAVLEICKRVPFGVLCFLPSYAFMEKLINRMKTVGLYDKLAEMKRIFMEPRSGPPKDFETLMKRYYDCISACKEGIGFSGKSANITGAVFFAVYRGKVSEGLDLADENCRAVIPVGIPYPAFKDHKVILKREFNDERNKVTNGKTLNGMQWYDTQAFRALNQALGRCIRHRLDWGAIILLEQRFTYPMNVKHLSKWVRSDVRTYKNFSDGMLALDQFVARNKSNEKAHFAEISAIKADMHQDISIEEDEY